MKGPSNYANMVLKRSSPVEFRISIDRDDDDVWLAGTTVPPNEFYAQHFVFQLQLVHTYSQDLWKALRFKSVASLDSSVLNADFRELNHASIGLRQLNTQFQKRLAAQNNLGGFTKFWLMILMFIFHECYNKSVWIVSWTATSVAIWVVPISSPNSGNIMSDQHRQRLLISAWITVQFRWSNGCPN